jgi:hypothetical protein
MKHLSDSCLVVDALGAAARKELLEEFVQVSHIDLITKTVKIIFHF